MPELVGNGRKAAGIRAERFAEAHLEAKGFRIVARNWRRPEGEIDLVADDNGVCVFVEVRSRTGEVFGHPLESVGSRKQARIVRAARLYLDEEPVSASAFRFDVVGVTFAPDGAILECVHIVDAFRVGG